MGSFVFYDFLIARHHFNRLWLAVFTDSSYNIELE